MSLYNPATADGQILSRSELDLIKAAVDILDNRSAYGGLVLSAPVGITINIAHEQLTVFDTLGALSRVTADTNDGSLTVDNAGDYLIRGLVAMTGLSDQRTYQMEIRLNDQATGAIAGGSPVKQQLEASLSYESIPATLAAGDRLSVYLWSDADSQSVTVDNAQLRLHRVG